MLMEFLLTALIAVLLSFLVAKLVSAVVGGGEVMEAAAAVVAEGGGGVVGEMVERVDRFEEVCRSEMLAAEAVVYGFGKDLVRVDDGDEEVESAAVEEEEEVDIPLFQEISESGLKEVEEIGGVVDEEGGGGVEFGDVNVVCSGVDDVVCTADGGRVVEILDEEGKETRCMDVEDADTGREEMEKEIKDEVADRIEECMRNIEGGVVEEEYGANEGCGNDFKEMAEPKVAADRIVGVIKRENIRNEGYKIEFETVAPKDVPDQICGVIEEEVTVNEFEETTESKDVPDQIDGVNEEDNSVKLAYKNKGGPEDVNHEVEDEVTEERSGCSEEDDDWEGIEMSELYSDFTSAAAFVRKEEKDGKLSNTGSELKMRLYGLQKIVMEGPCREAQPMAIKMSARAKWNAWQRLGNMNLEDAMKQYIALVSGLNPENARVDDQSHNIESTKLSISDPDLSKPQYESQNNKELTCNPEGIDIGSSSL